MNDINKKNDKYRLDNCFLSSKRSRITPNRQTNIGSVVKIDSSNIFG